MLKEELAHDNEKYAEVYLESTREPVQGPKGEVIHINALEKEISQTSEKLDMLNVVVNRYQKDIEGINVSLKSVSEWNSKLFEVKGKFVEMEKKCEGLVKLRKEVS